jgi:predicted small secreted protein
MKRINVLLILILAAVILAACAGQDGAGSAAKKYFQAIADGDEDRIATLSCPDWESSARSDVAAFKGVKARLENVTCKPVSSSSETTEDSSVVECSGAIVATYNNEDSNFELKGKQLTVQKQGGEWLVCGYAQ